MTPGTQPIGPTGRRPDAAPPFDPALNAAFNRELDEARDGRTTDGPARQRYAFDGPLPGAPPPPTAAAAAARAAGATLGRAALAIRLLPLAPLLALKGDTYTPTYAIDVPGRADLSGEIEGRNLTIFQRGAQHTLAWWSWHDQTPLAAFDTDAVGGHDLSGKVFDANGQVAGRIENGHLSLIPEALDALDAHARERNAALPDEAKGWAPGPNAPAASRPEEPAKSVLPEPNMSAPPTGSALDATAGKQVHTPYVTQLPPDLDGDQDAPLPFGYTADGLPKYRLSDIHSAREKKEAGPGTAARPRDSLTVRLGGGHIFISPTAARQGQKAVLEAVQKAFRQQRTQQRQHWGSVVVPFPQGTRVTISAAAQSQVRDQRTRDKLQERILTAEALARRGYNVDIAKDASESPGAHYFDMKDKELLISKDGSPPLRVQIERLGSERAADVASAIERAMTGDGTTFIIDGTAKTLDKKAFQNALSSVGQRLMEDGWRPGSEQVRIVFLYGDTGISEEVLARLLR